MVHLIDKDALIAEIENLKENARMSYSDYAEGRLDVCKELLSFVNTLEVKEVDLDKEVDDYINEHFSECDDGVLISDANSRELTLLDITPLAKHFFELGMAVSNKAQKGK